LQWRDEFQVLFYKPWSKVKNDSRE